MGPKQDSAPPKKVLHIILSEGGSQFVTRGKAHTRNWIQPKSGTGRGALKSRQNTTRNKDMYHPRYVMTAFISFTLTRNTDKSILTLQ